MMHIMESLSKRNAELNGIKQTVKLNVKGVFIKVTEKRWITQALTEEVPLRTYQLGLLVGQQIDVDSLNVLKVFHLFL